MHAMKLEHQNHNGKRKKAGSKDCTLQYYLCDTPENGRIWRRKWISGCKGLGFGEKIDCRVILVKEGSWKCSI